MARIEHEMQIRTADVVAMLAGLWLVLAPAFISLGSNALNWSSVVTGVVIIAFAALREYRLNVVWPDWVNMVAGAWAVLAPFVLTGATSGAKWSGVVAGLVALVAAAWSVEATLVPA